MRVLQRDAVIEKAAMAMRIAPESDAIRVHGRSDRIGQTHEEGPPQRGRRSYGVHLRTSGAGFGVTVKVKWSASAVAVTLWILTQRLRLASEVVQTR